MRGYGEGWCGGLVSQNRTATMISARKNPIPDRAAKTGATCELCCLVVNGTVDGVTGRLPPMEGRVVFVVEVVDPGTVVRGGKVWRTAGRVVGGDVAGGAVEGGAVEGTGVVGGVVPHRAVHVVVDVVLGTAPASGPASATPSISAAATAKRIVIAVRARFSQRRAIATSVAEPDQPGTSTTSPAKMRFGLAGSGRLARLASTTRSHREAT